MDRNIANATAPGIRQEQNPLENIHLNNYLNEHDRLPLHAGNEEMLELPLTSTESEFHVNRQRTSEYASKFSKNPL